MNIAAISTKNYYNEVGQVCAAPETTVDKTAASAPAPAPKPVIAKREMSLWEVLVSGKLSNAATGCAVDDEGKPAAPTATDTSTGTATGTVIASNPGIDGGSPNTFNTNTGTSINISPTEIVPAVDGGADDVEPTIISTTDAEVKPDLVHIVPTDSGPVIEPDREFMFDLSGSRSQLTNMILTNRITFNASGRKDEVIKLYAMPTPEVIDPRLVGITGMIDMTEVPCKKANSEGIFPTFNLGTDAAPKCIRNPLNAGTVIPVYVGEVYFEDLTGKVQTPAAGPLQILCSVDQSAANQCESVKVPYSFTVPAEAYNNNIGNFKFGTDFIVDSKNFTDGHTYQFAFKFAMQTLAKETK